MRGLAWYTGVIGIIGCVYMLTQLLIGIDIADNVWGITLNIPILVFAVLYIKKG